MNLQKAIEILSHPKFGTSWPRPKSEVKALKLGIEALKLYEHNRKIGSHHDPSYLPGETDLNHKDTSFSHNAHIHQNQRSKQWTFKKPSKF